MLLNLEMTNEMIGRTGDKYFSGVEKKAGDFFTIGVLLYEDLMIFIDICESDINNKVYIFSHVSKNGSNRALFFNLGESGEYLIEKIISTLDEGQL